MTLFARSGQALEVSFRGETVRIDPWGADSARVRASLTKVPGIDLGALGTPGDGPAATVSFDESERTGTLVNGELTVRVNIPNDDGNPTIMVGFYRTSDGSEILVEEREHFWWPGARVYTAQGDGAYEIHQQFRAYDGERLFGMGQYTHGRLNHKGLGLDLVQRNGEVSIPFALSNRGYGFLWNSPAIGAVNFADNHTRWTSNAATTIDYWVTVGNTPAQILENYTGAVGRAPELPDWASGFWQCKLRYRTQDELMEVAREHKRRGLPLSVIVSDYFHWTAMGDFKFDPEEWPDPKAMVDELEAMGVKLMVSIWPTISPLSENYDELRDNGHLIGVDSGVPYHQEITDKGMPRALPVAFYDPTNPGARKFVWDTVKKNYYDLGIKVWWLDACEPELNPGHARNLRLSAGPGAQTANLYPLENARAFAEGMAAEGEPPTVLLCRSAWVGAQKHGAAVWSGDIAPTFDSLARQVRAGLSVAVAGIPWWTTDIGGFHGGDSADEDYRELMIRWFQYGLYCPLFRLHGNRLPRTEVGFAQTGGPNEVWSYGEQAYGIITDVMQVREGLRPYVHEQLRVASTSGLPMMRPLFMDFPDDNHAWEIEDQFMCGTDILVAPITTLGQRSRSVYLPAGSTWRNANSGEVFEGGIEVQADAPLEYIPVFYRDNATHSTIAQSQVKP